MKIYLMQLEQKLKEQRRFRHRKLKSLLLAIFALILLTTIALGYFIWSMKTNKLDNNSIAGFFGSGVVNVLVMGVDERGDDAGRSDTLFLISLDTGTKNIKMLSIPRDTRVKIPGYGWDKINHAFAYGGHQLTEKTVEDLLGIKIDYYVAINIKAFIKIIDAVGGVTVDVEKRMYYEDPYDDSMGKGLVIDLKPGTQHMDGQTVIQYVRYRDEEGDATGRVQRQQKFMTALLDEVTKPSVLTKIPAIIKAVSSAINTDMSVGEMLNFTKMLNDAKQKGLQTATIPGKPAYIKDVSYWLPDINWVKEYASQIGGKKPDSKLVEKIAEEYETTLLAEIKIAEAPKDNKDSKEKEKDKPKNQQSPLTEKPETEQKGKAASSSTSKLKFTIVNASGSPEAAARMAAIVREKGFEVSSIVGSDTVKRGTVVTAHSSDNKVVGKLTGLPFDYAFQVSQDESRADRVTITIGKDFIK